MSRQAVDLVPPQAKIGQVARAHLAQAVAVCRAAPGLLPGLPQLAGQPAAGGRGAQLQNALQKGLGQAGAEAVAGHQGLLVHQLKRHARRRAIF